MICNNCGKRGHISKNCLYPKLSYGIILTKEIDNEMKVLMVQKKDTFCYIDFIRGKYNLYNPKHIRLLLSRFSEGELNNLLINSFDKLWYRLWYLSDPPPVIQNNSNEYIKSKIKFYKLVNGYTLQGKYITLISLINEVKTNTTYKSTEWEFPKGRKNNNEYSKDCAIRELMEETNIKLDDFKLYNNIIPYTETILGENNRYYKNIYYLGICKNSDNISINKDNKDQIYEICNIKFMNKDEVLNKIRDYNVDKINLINKIFDLLNNEGKLHETIE